MMHYFPQRLPYNIYYFSEEDYRVKLLHLLDHIPKMKSDFSQNISNFISVQKLLVQSGRSGLGVNNLSTNEPCL